MLETKALEFIKRHHLLEPGEKLAAGVSGGPDSLALLHFLYSIKHQFSLELTAIHVDHMFRGEESYEDLLFVEGFCKELGIPFEGIRLDAAGYMKETGESSQVAARKLRYSFYQEVMERHSIRKLALGHHGDDQIETILMRLTRGAAGAARAGIPIARKFGDSMIIRPFLGAEKEDIWDYCRRWGLKPRLDPSNQKEAYSRNRFRLRVLPFLKRENIKAHEHFQRFSEEIREDESYLQDLAASRMDSIWIKRSNRESSIRIKALLEMPNSLQRRAIQLILNYLYGGEQSDLNAKHLTQLRDLFDNPHPSAELHFPSGLLVKKSYDSCIFSYNHTKPKNYYLELNIPGESTLPNGCKIKASFCPVIPEKKGNDTFVLEAEEGIMLAARTREAGDRMNLKGLTGSKKVKDIFINEKIPMDERNTWPVIIDSAGEILWIPGLKKSGREPVDHGGQKKYIYLEYIKV